MLVTGLSAGRNGPSRGCWEGSSGKQQGWDLTMAPGIPETKT